MGIAAFSSFSENILVMLVEFFSDHPEHDNESDSVEATARR